MMAVNLFVAGFIGSPAMNFWPARRGGHARTSLGEFRLTTGCGGSGVLRDRARSHVGLRGELRGRDAGLARQPPARITFHATSTSWSPWVPTCCLLHA